MSTRFFSALVLAIFASCAFAQEPTLGPIIEGYGPVFAVENRDIPLNKNHKYRVVFELAKYSDDTTSMNQQLVRVARFMNMHAGQGVPAENMELSIVAHADAAKVMLNDESYQKRFGSKNPNRELLNKLADAGVEILICGQSMGFRNWDKSELASPVKMGLSAMTLISTRQSNGYTFQP